MLLRVFLLCCLFIYCAGSLLAQPSTPLSLRTIHFSGLKKFQADYLYQFLRSTPGNTLLPESIEADLQRLRNIPGIGGVDYRIDTVQTNLVLTFEVSEVRTLLPVVQFGGIRDNVWFRLGFTDVNWRGRGQLLSAHYQYNDNRHSGQLYFRVPHIKGSAWGSTASLQRWASREPLYFPEGTVLYDYDNHSVGGTIIRHIDFFRELELGGTAFVETYTKSSEQFLEAPPGPEALTLTKLLAKALYRSNRIDYFDYYLRGRSWRLLQQTVYNIDDRSWFHSFQFQVRQFIRTGKRGNLALRLRLGIANNDDTPFAPFVVDSHVNLRGVGNRIDRGTAQAVLNAEYRHTIFDKPLLAVQVVGFSDMGTWRNPGGALSDLLDPDQFRHFIGGGIRFIYPPAYGAILRIDYGMDVYNTQQRGLILGLGQYF